MINHKHKKNKIEHNEEILREIWNRIMIEVWSIIPTSLATISILTASAFTMFNAIAVRIRIPIPLKLTFMYSVTAVENSTCSIPFDL